MRGIRSFWGDSKAAAAVEFAIIAPLFLLVVMTLIAYGIYLGAAHSVQQIAADAARTAVAGLSEPEREQLVQTYLASASVDNAFIQRDKLKVTMGQDSANSNQFTVSIQYDASSLPIWSLYSFALPSQTIRSTATIRMGGI